LVSACNRCSENAGTTTCDNKYKMHDLNGRAIRNGPWCRSSDLCQDFSPCTVQNDVKVWPRTGSYRLNWAHVSKTGGKADANRFVTVSADDLHTKQDLLTEMRAKLKEALLNDVPYSRDSETEVTWHQWCDETTCVPTHHSEQTVAEQTVAELQQTIEQLQNRLASLEVTAPATVGNDPIMNGGTVMLDATDGWLNCDADRCDKSRSPQRFEIWTTSNERDRTLKHDDIVWLKSVNHHWFGCHQHCHTGATCPDDPSQREKTVGGCFGERFKITRKGTGGELRSGDAIQLQYLSNQNQVRCVDDAGCHADQNSGEVFHIFQDFQGGPIPELRDRLAAVEVQVSEPARITAPGKCSDNSMVDVTREECKAIAMQHGKTLTYDWAHRVRYLPVGCSTQWNSLYFYTEDKGESSFRDCNHNNGEFSCFCRPKPEDALTLSDRLQVLETEAIPVQRISKEDNCAAAGMAEVSEDECKAIAQANDQVMLDPVQDANHVPPGCSTHGGVDFRYNHKAVSVMSCDMTDGGTFQCFCRPRLPANPYVIEHDDRAKGSQCSDRREGDHNLLDVTEDECREIARRNGKEDRFRVGERSIWTPLGCSTHHGVDYWYISPLDGRATMRGAPKACGIDGFKCFCHEQGAA